MTSIDANKLEVREEWSLPTRCAVLDRIRELETMLSSGIRFQEQLQTEVAAYGRYRDAFCSTCRPQVSAMRDGECVMCNEFKFANERDRAEAAANVLAEAIGHLGEVFSGRRLESFAAQALEEALAKLKEKT